MTFSSQLISFRLSPPLRRIRAERAASGRPAVPTVCEIEIAGRLDEERLRAALADLVERHDALRTTFPDPADDGDDARAVVGEPYRPAMGRSDLGGDTGDALAARLQALRTEALARPVGPSEQAEPDPEHLLRAHLLSADDRSILQLILPPEAADPASLEVLVRNLAALYGRATDPDDEPPLLYADVADWLNEILEAEEREAGRSHWRRQDLPAADAGRLGFEATPEAAASPVGRVETTLDPADRLRAVSDQLGVTLPALCQTGWELVLQRHATTPELLVAVGFDGRKHPELEDVMGLLDRRIPHRVGAEPRGTTAAERVRAVARWRDESADWQEYFSWDLLLGEEGDPGAPASRFVFDYRRTPAPVAVDCVRFTLGWRRVSPGEGGLALTCVESPSGTLDAFLDYDPRAWRAADVAALGEQWVALVEAIGEAPETPWERLSSSGPEDRRLLAALRGAPRARPPLFDRSFADRVAEDPERPAARSGDDTLSYGQLARRSHALAVRLGRLGIGPEDRVGICLARGLDLPTAVLAVLEAGAAFVPIEPTLPALRRAWMTEDAGCAVVLVDGDDRGGWPEGLPALAVSPWAAEASTVESTDDPPPPGPVGADSLAYVLYTSGSSGRPKGVMVSHGNLAHYLAWCRDRYLDETAPQVPVHTSIGFDLTLTSLLAPLTAGFRLLLIPDAIRPEALPTALAEHGETSFVKLTPSHLDLLRAAGSDGASLPTRALILGGEALRAETVAPWRQAGVELINEYGPTETTVGCTVHRVAPDDPASGAVAIGLPIDQTGAVPVGHDLEPVVRLATGELWVGGAGVARGYGGRPALTAERFVPDPFATEPGSRAYRTGDRVRRRATGDLEFVGRLDEQVKVRGHRIEPGEVEACLAASPEVDSCAVSARPDGFGGALLAAFVVAAPGTQPSRASLRDHLAERLPAPMVPSSFHLVTELPLTPSGKVDRRQLAERAEDRAGLGGGTAPGTVTEELLAGIWSRLLGGTPVARGDDFFELGGHSLTATRLLTRIARAFGVDLPMRDLFDHSDLRAMAERIDGARASGDAAPPAPPVRRVERRDALPVSPAQERLWLLDRLDPGSPAYVVPTAVRLVGAVEARLLSRALSELVRRHESLRTVFVERDGEPFQVVRPAAGVPLPVVDLSALPEDRRGAEAERRARREARRPFDLAAGPLTRTVLLHLGAEERVLLLTMHHIVSDAWSLELLTRELALLYGAYAEGRPSPLPELEIQLADFTTWQRDHLESGVLERQLSWWTDELAGAPHVLDLPAPAQPDGDSDGRTAVAVQRQLATETVSGLRELAGRESATPFMVVTAAFEVVLGHLTGQRDFVLGSNSSGRHHPATEELIGFFVNLLPLRARLDGQLRFRDLLSQVRETTLGAFAHPDVPFELLVQELDVARRPGSTPLVQAVVSFQATDREAPEVPGIRLEPFETGHDALKFDLVLSVTDDGTRIGCSLALSPTRFDRAAASRLLDQLELTLATVIADPTLTVDDLDRCFADRAREEAAGERERFRNLRSRRRPFTRAKTVPSTGGTDR